MCTSLESSTDKDVLALKDNLHWLNLSFIVAVDYMVVSGTWCMLKWKRTVYDLKISILSMSVAKILSDVNCLQMIFDLTNSVLEWTNASS